MCGRFALSVQTDDIEKLQAGLVSNIEIQPRFNIAPSQEIAAILNIAPKEVRAVRWGLIPFWADSPAIGYKMINARGETIDQKPSFKYPFKKKRCLIFATGFYEWKKKSSKGGKIPYYFHMKTGKVFTFAGLWDTWEKGEKPITSTTIITTQANETVKPIHERMPVIIKQNQWDEWLSPDSNTSDLKKMIQPYINEEMETYQVSQQVNSPQNEFPELIEKYTLLTIL